MKQIVMILGLVILILQVALGQESMIYDFESKNPPTMVKAKLGEFTVFRVENINKFLYEVKIESKQIEFISESPAVFDLVFKKEEKVTSIVDIVAGKIGDRSVLLEEDKICMKLKSDNESNLEISNSKLGLLNKELNFQKDLPNSSRDPAKISELDASINKLTKDTAELRKAIKALNAITDEYLKILQELQSKALNVHNSFELLEKSKALKNRLVGISLTDGLTYDESLKKTNELFVKFPFIDYPEELIDSFERAYRQFKSTYELYLVNAIVRKKIGCDESKIKSNVETLYNEIESLKSLSVKENYAEIFQNINTLFSELRNKNNFSVVSDPVQAEKDVINFNIKITPRNSINTSGGLEGRQFSASVPIKGGVKIDFSTGLFITMGLNDRKYSVNPSSNDTLKSIISEDKNNNFAQVLLGALMHISKRTTSNFKLGGTFGFGLNTTNISNANIFLGASCIFGSREMFIVSTGLSLANIDYLKGNYKLKTEYTTTSIDSDITEKTLRPGWFISFTYNLTNLKKE